MRLLGKHTICLLRSLVLAVLFKAMQMQGQEAGDGALSGRVLLANGSPASQVRLEFRRFAENNSEEEGEDDVIRVQTDRNGRFGLVTLPAGMYRVEMKGSVLYAGSTSTVLVQESASSTAIIQLRPAGTTANVAIPVMAPNGAAPSQMDAGQLQQLPVNAGEWESLPRASSIINDATTVNDVPGQERDGFDDTAEAARRGGAQAGSTEAASGLSFAGLPVTQNAERVDGLSNDQEFRSGPRGAAAGGPVSGSSSYGQGAVRSLRILPRSFSAQLGNPAGNGLAVRTRRGTSELHGGAFYLLRESAFAAANPYSTVTQYSNGVVTSSLVKPQDELNQFGGHISLPLTRDHRRRQDARTATLFASVEEQVRSNPLISTPSIPSFYTLSPVQTTVLRVRGVSTASQVAALNYLDSLSGPVDRHANRTLVFLRADTQISARDHLGASYALNRFRSPAGTGFDQDSDAVTARGRASVGDRAIDANALNADWRHIFTRHANQELRFQWARDLESETPHTPLPQEPAISPGGFAPQVAIEPNGFTYGTPSGLGRSAYPDEQRLQGSELLLYARGRHLVSLGGEWGRADDHIAQLSNAAGAFLYDSATTGAGGLVDWITDYTFSVNAYPNGGCPSIFAAVHDFCFRSFAQSFGGEDSSFVTNNFAGFAEDNFHVRSGLSLSLGVRYEYVLLPLPQAQNSALDAAFANVGGALQGATSSFPEDRNNVGPRVALMWKPTHGSFGTVHIGYGVFYGRLTGATTHAALTDTALRSSTTQIRITPSTEVACPQVAGSGFGFPCVFEATPPASVVQTSSALLFAKGFRLPAVQRGSLLWERALGRHGSVHAEYAGSIATQLPGSSDLNIAPATVSRTFVVQGGDSYPGLHTGQTFTVPLYTARRVPQYGPVTSVVSNANSTYHAGTVEMELRGWHSFEVRGSFTFSRAIDYGPQQGATPRENGQFDPFANGYDKGLSSLDFPVRFSGQLLYQSQFRAKSPRTRAALNDWHVSSIAFAGSGAPYSYGIFGGTRLNGGRESLNGSGGANYLPTVGRNTLRLPPRASVDVRLGREWTSGSLKVSLFAEAFNALNQRSLSRVETRAFLLGTPASAGAPTPLIFQDAAAILTEGLTAQPFGTPTSSTTSLSRERQAEIGVRLVF